MDGRSERSTRTHYRASTSRARAELPGAEVQPAVEDVPSGRTYAGAADGVPGPGSTFTILASSAAGTQRVDAGVPLVRAQLTSSATRPAGRTALGVEEAVSGRGPPGAELATATYRLPLDLRVEVHVPADRLSLAYRRALLDDLRPASIDAAPVEMAPS